MLTPRIRAARPSGWIGGTTFAALVVFTLLALLTVLLVRLPVAWVQWTAGSEWILRGVLFIALWWGLGWLRQFIYSRLPQAPFVWGNTLVLWEAGHRRKIPVASVAEVFSEVRPPPIYEQIRVRLHDGTDLPLCPLDWAGAPQLWAALRHQVARGVESKPHPQAKSP